MVSPQLVPTNQVLQAQEPDVTLLNDPHRLAC